jgi:hypothetical protein
MLGTFGTCRLTLRMSVYRGRSKSSAHPQNDAIGPRAVLMWLSRAVSLARRSKSLRISVVDQAVPGERRDQRIDITRGELIGRCVCS